MKTYETKAHRVIVGRLEQGDDLLSGLYEVAEKHGMKAADVRALGAVTDLEVTEWDPEKKAYREPIRRKDPSEVLTLYGNLSRRDGKPFWHVHISAAYHEGGKTRLVAGHLLRANVFALEFVIDVFEGIDLVRVPDEKSGLFLWK